MTHGSLFDGAGGLRIGLEAAGFSTRWRLDILNGPKENLETINLRRLARVDLISGGPPCQKGSIAAFVGKRRTGFTKWPEMLRIVKAKQPLWVVVENVLGFLPEMVDWSRQLQRLGYGCAGQCIGSRHWVPQHRTRAFIVGRLGTDGLALWNHLYAGSQRVQTGKARRDGEPRRIAHYRPCGDCMRSGVPTRIPGYDFALMGAGNAVTVGLAAFLGSQIIRTEREINAGH